MYLRKDINFAKTFGQRHPEQNMQTEEASKAQFSIFHKEDLRR